MGRIGRGGQGFERRSGGSGTLALGASGSMSATPSIAIASGATFGVNANFLRAEMEGRIVRFLTGAHGKGQVFAD